MIYKSPEDLGDKLLRKARGREFTKGDAVTWLGGRDEVADDIVKRLVSESRIMVTGKNDTILFYRATS